MQQQQPATNQTVPTVDLREYIRGNKPRDPVAHPHTGEVDNDRIRRLLSLIQEHYDPEPDQPPRAEDTRLYQMIRRIAATDTATTAVRNGNAATMSYLTGDPGRKSDISGLKAINTVNDMLLAPAPIIYIWGEPGSGKTDFALLLAQLWQREHGGEMASNIRTWREQDHWIASYPQLEDWLAEQLTDIEGGGVRRADHAEPRLFVFDEASSHAAGRGEQGHNAAMLLGPMVKKIRKANAGIIIIGHDGKDVHPVVRTLATAVKKRRGERKRAWVYESVRNRDGVNLMVELDGIPPTDYSYDTGEATSWQWEAEEEQERLSKQDARELAEDLTTGQMRRFGAELAAGDYGLTHEQIGTAIGDVMRGEPYSKAAVTKWKQALENGDMGMFDP